MNFDFLLKVLVSALVIVGVSELGKKWSLAGALLASLPLTSILAMLWLYRDTHDTGKIINLSHGIFWAVLPSLFFFIILPVFLKKGLSFGWAMGLSCLAMAVAYGLYVAILKEFNVQI